MGKGIDDKYLAHLSPRHKSTGPQDMKAHRVCFISFRLFRIVGRKKQGRLVGGRNGRRDRE